MSTQIQVTKDYIERLHPLSVVKDAAIGDHFINKFVAMYRVPKEQAIAFHEREKDNFIKRITDSEDLSACTPMSIFLAYMQVGGWQLSFEGGPQSDVYLIPGNRNIAPKGQPDKWIKEVVAQPTPYGEKKIRIQNGQIKDAAKPIIVCKGDTYEEYTDDHGNVRVTWKKGNRGDNPIIIGSFIRIEKLDGSYEIKTFDMGDVAKWKASSENKNAKWDAEAQRKLPGKANALYTSNNGQIDKLFFEGKTLKHAFKLYPKVVNAPKLPETFVPVGADAIRQGFDVSEFTDAEVVPNEQINAPATDDFSQALAEAETQPAEETHQFANAGDHDDEPSF
ncbi:recombinase RecT [Pedobacter metabolipauper]|uniref:RecT family protein n=1 Tax=Pedobacter metabolipauper TaxID=425513 RepID=A0A4R6SZX9_9SPHI|nr:recombinase RecT [Pedobacter metabolipauper]TDQ12806.1 RecT family protein [Pedobacter metabolipauper]